MRPIFFQTALIIAPLAAVAGGIFLLAHQPSSDGIEIVLPTATAVPEMRVYISGAVRSPGVYPVMEGDRLARVVEAAGGATEDADLAAVNLAARVEDKDHWHIPRLGETVAVATPQAGALAGKVQINSADAEELASLPGIGPVRAEAIMRYREANGPFSSAEDLLAVSGIGPVRLEAIRDLIEVP